MATHFQAYKAKLGDSVKKPQDFSIHMHERLS